MSSKQKDQRRVDSGPMFPWADYIFILLAAATKDSIVELQGGLVWVYDCWRATHCSSPRNVFDPHMSISNDCWRHEKWKAHFGEDELEFLNGVTTFVSDQLLELQNSNLSCTSPSKIVQLGREEKFPGQIALASPQVTEVSKVPNETRASIEEKVGLG